MPALSLVSIAASASGLVLEMLFDYFISLTRIGSARTAAARSRARKGRGPAKAADIVGAPP